MEYEEELDYAKLRYVLYARKSSIDEARQVKSIPDQIDECLKLAERLHLNIVKPYLTESKSAKLPNNRPVFRAMLSDIQAGKYDGILAWNPDRLARNMLEGGHIINMIDEGVIKDLKFATHHFTKDANGKMLLGIAFVLSKQYSDKLSQDVKRGVESNLAKGKSPTPKYGYVNESGLYYPDENNHQLICDAWRMRKEGEPIKSISNHLNEHGFYKEIKSSGKKTYMTPQKLSDMFKDSFYYGKLIQANQMVDLREMYEFIPATTEEDFMAIQELSYRRIKPPKPHRAVFYPLKLMVHCSFCNQSMRVAPSTSQTKKKRYLYFRCDTKGCDRKKKSIRSKVIFDFIIDFLQDGLGFTEKEYQQYLDGMKYLSDDHKVKIRGELNTKRGLVKRRKQEIKELSLNIAKLDPVIPAYKTILNQISGKIAELEVEIEGLEADVAKLEEQLKKSEDEVASLEDFANLSKNAASIVQSADAVGKDMICKLIFANFTVDEQKVASYRLKEPFDILMKQRKFLFSRGTRN